MSNQQKCRCSLANLWIWEGISKFVDDRILHGFYRTWGGKIPIESETIRRTFQKMAGRCWWSPEWLNNLDSPTPRRGFSDKKTMFIPWFSCDFSNVSWFFPWFVDVPRTFQWTSTFFGSFSHGFSHEFPTTIPVSLAAHICQELAQAKEPLGWWDGDWDGRFFGICPTEMFQQRELATKKNRKIYHHHHHQKDSV